MPKSLLDLIAQAPCVADVPVYGVSIEGIAALLMRFAELRVLMGGGYIDAEKLMAEAPQAVGPIIAAGTGYPGDVEHERAAALMSADLQLDFLRPILERTFPEGIGPFVAKLTALGALFVEKPAAAAGESATATTAPATS